MMRGLIVLLLICTLQLANFSSRAPAASVLRCTDRNSILRRLQLDWREIPVARGVTNDGAIVELLESEDGATWTLIISFPSGASCLWAAGDSWQRMPPSEKGRQS